MCLYCFKTIQIAFAIVHSSLKEHNIAVYTPTNNIHTNNTPPVTQVMVPKLIHPLPPNTPTTPKSPSSRSDDIEEEPPTPHPGINDTWMQVCGGRHLIGTAFTQQHLTTHNHTTRPSMRSALPHPLVAGAFRVELIMVHFLCLSDRKV